MTTARAEPRAAPPADCPLCPRLASYRAELRTLHPGWHNAPVPSFGAVGAVLLVVGLAPGAGGANRTGRPFTGDFAGELLYPGLLRHGLGRGRFAADPADGVVLDRARITNAVRCVPPANKPVGAEIRTCRQFLDGELHGPAAPRVILALGRIAHESVLRALGLRPAAVPFGHGAEHRLADGRVLVASYHTSRYNVNTGVLTEAMFRDVMARVAALVEAELGEQAVEQR